MPPTGGPEKASKSHVEVLEQEMKLLHWHKLANEAALKAAIIRYVGPASPRACGGPR